MLRRLRFSAQKQLFAHFEKAATRLDRLLAGNEAWTAAIAFAVVLQLALIVTHIPWLDETQALLIAWQSPDLSALLANLRYEGHPPLWYLLLRGLAHVVPFEWVLPLSSAAIALALQALIFAKAPFPRSELLMLALSEITLVEFGAISRSLALGALMIFAACALWRSRAVWIAIAVLPLCDFVFGVLSLILVAGLWHDRRVWWPGMALWAIASLGAAWSVIPAPDLVTAEYHMGPLLEFADFVQRIGGLALPFQTFIGRIAWDGFPPFGIGALLAPLLIAWLWVRTAGDRFQRVAIFGYLGFCFLFSVFVYPLHFRHLTTVALLLIALTWTAPQSYSDREQMRWRAWLMSCAVCGMLTAAVMLSRPFDAAPQVATAMLRVDDGKRPWLVWPVDRAPALFPHTGLTLVQPEQGCSHSFARWNHRSAVRDANDLLRALPTWARRYGQSFLVLKHLPKGIPETLFRPLTPRLRGYDGQTYVVGILGPTEPIRPLSLQPCVQGLRPIPVFGR